VVKQTEKLNSQKPGSKPGFFLFPLVFSSGWALGEACPPVRALGRKFFFGEELMKTTVLLEGAHLWNSFLGLISIKTINLSRVFCFLMEYILIHK